MPPEANVGSTLIWYKSNRPDNMKYWHDTVDEYLKGILRESITERLQAKLQFNPV